jgi:DNA-binding MarR family transcriptional regulator
MIDISPERRRLIDDLDKTLDVLQAAIARRRGRDTHRSGTLGMAHLRLVAELYRAETADGAGREGGTSSQSRSGARLAHAAGLSPAAVSEMLDHLERAGVVTRERSTLDRRAQVVSLTEHGRNAYEQKHQALFERGVAALADCSDAELGGAVKVMTRIARIFDTDD